MTERALAAKHWDAAYHRVGESGGVKWFRRLPVRFHRERPRGPLPGGDEGTQHDCPVGRRREDLRINESSRRVAKYTA